MDLALIRDVLPHMIEWKFGRIGLTAFCAGTARRVAEHNVAINNVPPGFYATDRQRNGFAATSRLTGRSVEDLAEERLRSVPANRFGEPREFGLACAFLCSADMGYIIGQNLLVDGGRFESAF